MQEPIEDTPRVWRCGGAGSDEVWKTAIDRFRQDLGDDGTNPNTCEAICNGLLVWWNSIPQDYTNYKPAIQELVERQNKMG